MIYKVIKGESQFRPEPTKFSGDFIEIKWFWNDCFELNHVLYTTVSAKLVFCVHISVYDIFHFFISCE